MVVWLLHVLQIHIEISTKNVKEIIKKRKIFNFSTCDWSNCFSRSSVSFGVITEQWLVNCGVGAMGCNFGPFRTRAAVCFPSKIYKITIYFHFILRFQLTLKTIILITTFPSHVRRTLACRIHTSAYLQTYIPYLLCPKQ